MAEKIYGLTRSGNRYFYALDDQALAVELELHPKAWRKTPDTPWKRAHGQFLRLDNLGLGFGLAALELDPIVEFDRSSLTVFRLIPSTGNLEYEPDWTDSISFAEWDRYSNWRNTVSDLMGQIDLIVLGKLRQFSHFHFRLLEALHDWQGFEDLLDTNPFLATALAGRIRVGPQGGPKRSPLDYGSLVLRSERDIASTLGFGDSEEVVMILKKMVPDVCKPYVIINFLDLLENPATRKVLIEAETLSYPALLLLQNPYLAPKLTGSFISEFAEAFPTHLDIVFCPWGTLLRGKGKGDEFTNTFQMALDVVLSDPNAIIYSMDDLGVKNCLIGWTYRR